VAGPRRSRDLSRAVKFAMSLFGVLIAVTTGFVLADRAGTTTTTTSTTTTTTVPIERPQVGWTVASASKRGVMVDYRDVAVGDVAEFVGEHRL